MRKGYGGTPKEEGALPLSFSSAARRPLVNRGLGPACPFLPVQEADGESPGGQGELASLAAAAGLLLWSVFSCCRCPREQAGVEPRRLGCLAALRKALGGGGGAGAVA